MDKKILIIEDEENILSLFRDIFSDLSVSLYTETDAFAGLRVTRQIQPDLIILDLNLPLMSGIEFLKITREFSATSEIPVIVTSGRREMDIVVELKKYSISGYMVKPFSPKMLIDKVEEVLKTSISDG